MLSLHTGNSVPLIELLERGARITQIGKTKIYSVEFPPKDEVGAVCGTWQIEDHDIEHCARLTNKV